jgi:hypothetical protein
VSSRIAYDVFNWQAGAWEPLRDLGRDTSLAPADAYVAPDGALRLRVTSSLAPSAAVPARFYLPVPVLHGEVGG